MKYLTTSDMTGITTTNVRYLKHVGRSLDVKVTYRTVRGEPVLFIRDHEFFSFAPARRYVQQIAETELIVRNQEAA